MKILPACILFGMVYSIKCNIGRFLILVCPFVCFLLVIVLSVLLRFTDSDYPFGIFKLFLSIFCVFEYHVFQSLLDTRISYITKWENKRTRLFLVDRNIHKYPSKIRPNLLFKKSINLQVVWEEIFLLKRFSISNSTSSTNYWPQQFEDYVRESTWQLEKAQTIYRFHELVFNRGHSNLEWFHRTTNSYALWKYVYLCFTFLPSVVVCPFVLFSVGHCVVSHSIYGFWLHLWYLQTLLVEPSWFLVVVDCLFLKDKI